jgi:signal transduction histidine kinase/DNA-binding response OmpR family regulator
MPSARGLALLSGFCLCAALAGAQPTAPTPPAPKPSEEGRPFIRIYRPAELGGDFQNWAIVQDKRGVIYVGSQSGVLEFDGANWRIIETPTLDTVRSLAIDEAGRVYAGSVGEFGYLAPDAGGELRYVSLVDRVPQAVRRFSDVWRVFATPQGVLFQSEEYVFRWAGDKITVIPAASRFSRSSFVDGRFYASLPESGLNVLDGDTFRPLPGTTALAREVYPVVLRYDDKRLLIGTRRNGLFLYDGTALVPFPTEVDALIEANSLYRGLVLANGTIALGTTGSGLAIIDRQGHRVTVLDEPHGLPSNAAYYLMVDREGALWNATDRGIARIETPSASSFFDRTDGYRGVVDLTRHDSRVYLAAPSGVTYLHDATPADPTRMSQIPGLVNQCWSFAEMQDRSGRRPAAFAVACSDGLYEIRGTTAVAVRASADYTYRAAFLLASHADPTRLWVGLFDGLASFRWVDGRWIDEGRVEPTRDQVRTLFENPDGSLWAGTSSTGLLRVRFATRPAAGVPRPAASIDHFGTAQGLPAGGIGVAPAGGEPYFVQFGAARKMFIARYDSKAGTFTHDATLETLPFDRLRPGFGLADGLDGHAYANFGRGTAMLTRAPDGSWTIDNSVFARFGQVPTGVVLAERDGVVWFGLQGDFVRFDRSHASSGGAPYPALIRRITSNRNRMIFDGAGSAAAPRLPAVESTLRFEFAAPSFLDETATEYQTLLDGADRDWSAWSTEPRRDYMNLGYGSYRFRVRARNIAGRVSDEAVYAFTILPPWYRTWWADLGWVLLLGVAVFAADRLQRRRLLGKERERARFAEARLRAESAEALAQSEGEGKKNIELLSDIGREITASLDFDTIFDKLYTRVNRLTDADVFGVGLYHPERHEIEYRLAIEQGKRYAPYTRDTADPDQLPVWCIEHRQPVLINDLKAEYHKYLSRYEEPRRQLQDGSMSLEPQSLIYLPLVAKNRVLGIFTIQSFETQAYTEHDLNMMQSLASYTAIALDNAAAYRQLNEQEHENRRLFEEAERARAIAEDADAAKSAFLSTVSHELRTPLTSVLGFAKIIKKRLEERIFPLVHTDDRRVVQTMLQVEENLKVVVSEGERLTKLIDDVLDLAKIEAGKLEWQMETVSIPDVIEHATAATASLFDQKKLRLIKQLDADLPQVTGDRDRLIQVVINLISNAVKFTDAGSVTCRAARRGGEIVVSITDTGVGISPSDQPKVFERFKQVGDTLTDKPKGTGLGLPICREIVDHHGGRIWVESAPGHGSTFSFALPLAGEAIDSGKPVELAALIRQLRDHVVVSTPRTSERQPRILVVDDEANIRELLMQEFTDAGYRVSVAVNGRDAVASVRRERPDLIVLDVMMPEMNGFDVAAVLKNDPQTLDIPIVILSIVQDRDRGFRLGVDRYLTKPIDTDLLFREVGTLIEQKKSRKHVLVVDEDASTVKTLGDVLKTRGYTVSEARGVEMIEKAKALQPDIIMLNTVSSGRPDVVQALRFEKGLENVLFLVYQ